MFFVMCDTQCRQTGRVYQRRVGAMTTSLMRAKRNAVRVKGYIVNEGGELIAQAYSEKLPRHVSSIKNISSREDCVY